MQHPRNQKQGAHTQEARTLVRQLPVPHHRNCEVGRRRGSRCLPASQQLLIPLLFGRDVICHQRTRYAMTLSSSRLQLSDGFLKCVDQPDRNLFDVPVQAPNGFQIASHNGILDVEIIGAVLVCRRAPSRKFLARGADDCRFSTSLSVTTGNNSRLFHASSSSSNSWSLKLVYA
jgi:hypothetical protein